MHTTNSNHDDHRRSRPTSRRRRRTLIGALATAAVAAAALPAASVSADAAYHTEHAPLRAIGDEPLTSGFVNNIHAQGPTVYAMEYYHLVQARPNTTYTVVIYLHPGDQSRGPDCTGEAIGGGLLSSQITTNAAGNGHAASMKFTPELVAPLRGAEYGVRWVVVDETQEPVFETDCGIDVLD